MRHGCVVHYVSDTPKSVGVRLRECTRFDYGRINARVSVSGKEPRLGCTRGTLRTTMEEIFSISPWFRNICFPCTSTRGRYSYASPSFVITAMSHRKNGALPSRRYNPDTSQSPVGCMNNSPRECETTVMARRPGTGEFRGCR